MELVPARAEGLTSSTVKLIRVGPRDIAHISLSKYLASLTRYSDELDGARASPGPLISQAHQSGAL